MSSGLSIDLPVRLSVYRESTVARGVFRNPPGYVISTIEVGPLKTKEFNPLKINFVVSPYRPNDLKKVVIQSKRKSNLSYYSQSLFESCFKNWEEVKK